MRWDRHAVWWGGAALLIALATNVALPRAFKLTYSTAEGAEATSTPAVPRVPHVATPEAVKAIYMTACVASTPAWREKLKELINTTELNAVVIDIKDSTGTISFKNDFPQPEPVRGCVVSDLKEFIAELHKSGIYVIGRISVFQDPSYSLLFPELAVKSKASGGVWKDRKGLSFIDVGAKPYWDFVVSLSEAAYAQGFDELNYDYIRYPSDGNMSDANFTWTPKHTVSSTDATGQATSSEVLMTKAEVLESFFSFLRKKVSGTGPVISADIFGMTTTVATDMGIGQVLERALPYFDYVAPMVYPSHYPATWSGFQNPAEHPYDVIKIAMSGGREREVALNIANGLATSTPSKLRPWLQDFDLGATYGAPEVRAQIQAAYDVGLSSWLLWSAANTYTAEALKAE